MKRKSLNLKKLMILFSLFFLIVFKAQSFGEFTPGNTMNSQPFPSYGNGKVIVRLYTDYFCSPCRAVEPEIEPLLVNLVRSKRITVTLIDTPIYKGSQLYARYFLFALNTMNNLEYAIRSRAALFEAAGNKIIGKDTLEEFLKEKGIAFAFFDVIPVLKKLNGFLQDDKITGTPCCVILKDGKREKKVGGREIVKALKELHQDKPSSAIDDRIN